MSDFSKSVLYSGLVLVAGLIAIFSISSNMTQYGAPDAGNFAMIEPAAGDMTDMDTMEMGMDAMDDAQTAADTANNSSINDEALEKLRAALKDAGVDVSDIEPAAGDETTGNVFIDMAPAE